MNTHDINPFITAERHSCRFLWTTLSPNLTYHRINDIWNHGSLGNNHHPKIQNMATSTSELDHLETSQAIDHISSYLSIYIYIYLHNVPYVLHF